MIPQAFEYHAPKSLAEASRLVAQFAGDGKVLAGGHSLVPMMKLRLAAPKHLIDIGRIKELSYIRPGDSKVEIGALTTHLSSCLRSLASSRFSSSAVFRAALSSLSAFSTADFRLFLDRSSSRRALPFLMIDVLFFAFFRLAA